MEMAVTEVWFMAGTEWYIQRDGVAMGAAMAVILANLWLKQFEDQIFSASNENTQSLETCRKCRKKVTRQGYSVQCAKCKVWSHRKCTPFSVEDLKRTRTTSWTCGCESDQPSTAKIAVRYVDDVIRSAKTQEIDEILDKSNKLHANLEFTVEKLENDSIPFLDMLVTVKDGKITTAWYQKPTDTGLVLSFRSLAPTIFKRNIIQGTVHRIFNATSNWQKFDEGLSKAQMIWENNQYPPQFTQPIVRKCLSKLLGREPETVNQTSRNSAEHRACLVMQYRGKISDQFSKRLKRTTGNNVIFTMRKLKTALPSLKAKVPRMLKSNVVYQINCPGCQSSYVGQTTRHLSTRIREHSRTSSNVGEHLSKCGVTLHEEDVKIIDSSSSYNKLLTLEALHIQKRKPTINTKEEYRSRELTLRV